MAHRSLRVVMVTFFAVILGAAFDCCRAADGAQLFASLKCAACHKPDQKAVGASLAEIARAYGDSAKLAGFFKEGSPFLIESTKTGMMKGQLKNLSTLADEERKALADYVLTFR